MIGYGYTCSVSGGREGERYGTGCDFCCRGGVDGSQHIGSRIESTRTSAPRAARSDGHRSIEGYVWIVGTHGAVQSGIGSGCRCEIDGYLICYCITIIVSGGGEGKYHTSESNLSGCWGVKCIECICVGVEITSSTAPRTTGGYSHRSIELCSGVVGTEGLVRTSLGCWCRAESVGHLIGHCHATSISGRGEGEGNSAVGYFAIARGVGGTEGI